MQLLEPDKEALGEWERVCKELHAAIGAQGEPDVSLVRILIIQANDVAVLTMEDKPSCSFIVTTWFVQGTQLLTVPAGPSEHHTWIDFSQC
jgi:hypothetical protein